MSTTSLNASSSLTSGMFAAGTLDVNNIVTQLMSAKSTQQLKPYQTQLDSYREIKSALQTLNTKLSSLKSAASALADTDKLSSGKVAVSDDDILTASSSGGAQVGEYSVIVRQTAVAESWTGNVGKATLNDTLTSSALTITQGEGEDQQSFSIDASGMTLESLRDKINNSELDLKATVLYTGSEYRLQLTSTKTGEDYGFTVTGDIATELGMQEKISAKNSIVNINTTLESDAIERSSNTITDILPGLTLNLKTADPANPVRLTVSSDTAVIEEKLGTFFTKYNEALSYLNEQFTYNTETETSGPLSKSSTARSIQMQLQTLVSSRISGIGEDANYKTLSDIGVRMNNDGTIYLDKTAQSNGLTRLANALSDDYDSVMKILGNSGSTTDSRIQYLTAGSSTTPGTYRVNITTPPQAKVAAGSAMEAILSVNERLAFAYGTKSFSIDLSSGDDSAAVLSKINGALSTNSVPVSASLNENVLNFFTTNAGGDGAFTVQSDVASGGTGIGTSLLTAQGIDIAGTFTDSLGNVYTGVGSGSVLTGATGTPAAGLMISGAMGIAGEYGTVTATFGVVENLSSKIEAIMNTSPGSEGSLTREIESLDSNIQNVNETITQLNERLEVERQLLFDQYNEANQTLSQLQLLQSSLTSSMGR